MSGFASQNLTMGQVNAIVKKLGGEEETRRFLRGETVVREAVPPEFKVFKVLKLGTGLKNANAFRKAIDDKGMRIGKYANNILDRPQFTMATEETEVNLVVVSVAELGFKDGAWLRDIYARAKKLGLELCPNEVGPQLRLRYVEQPRDEWLLIGMEVIVDLSGNLCLFGVGRSGAVLWIDGYHGSPDNFWNSDGRFVFVLPRK